MSPFAAHRAHFEANALRPLPEVDAPPLPEPRRLALARSLARFQLGESGEGRVAHEIDRVTLPFVDADYRRALKLFVAEEGRHGRILGLMVNALGGRLLARNWTERLFVRGRRLFGVRFKLLVLLAAEVIGIGFYGLLAKAVGPGAMARALEQICKDEEHHLAFHCDFLRHQGWLLRLLWWPLGTAAALTVLFDHRQTLAAFEVPLGQGARVLFNRVLFAAQSLRGFSALRRAPSSTPGTAPGR